MINISSGKGLVPNYRYKFIPSEKKAKLPPMDMNIMPSCNEILHRPFILSFPIPPKSHYFTLPAFCAQAINPTSAGIILCMCPANEWWHYNVTLSLIGWVHTQNDPCFCYRSYQSPFAAILVVYHVLHIYDTFSNLKGSTATLVPLIM